MVVDDVGVGVCQGVLLCVGFHSSLFIPCAASRPSPLDLRICSIDLFLQKCCLDLVGSLSLIYFDSNFIPPCFRLDHPTFFFLPSFVFHQKKKNLIPTDIEPPPFFHCCFSYRHYTATLFFLLSCYLLLS